MKTLCRLILPPILQSSTLPKTIEGEFTQEEITAYNKKGYNIYYWPNYPKVYNPAKKVSGADIDTFEYVIVDFDLKTKAYPSKEDFVKKILENDKLLPSKIIDSGNGIHAYWRVMDLDAKSYLQLSRRLMRYYNTDEAVGTLSQLMRLPETYNTKQPDNLKLCTEIASFDITYCCEQLDLLLPPLNLKDMEFCETHYNNVHNPENIKLDIAEEMPKKFGKLLLKNEEVKNLWTNSHEDRSKSDYRLAHLMYANEFTKEEAARVLYNSAKALSRTPTARASYVKNMIDKIWTYDLSNKDTLSESVASILNRKKDTLKGTPFRCNRWIDDTKHGFRLGQVIGLVAGSGVGKTAFALNMFNWFAERNPDYHHFFIPLEQPAAEIADRWSTMCGSNTTLHEKVHVISNYDENGAFRHLSFSEIKDYIMEWQEKTGNKVGCIVIDHIGALKKKGKNGENQDLMDICHAMKGFAVETNTLLVMQSQAPREKAGIGDLELNKDAAYGTVYFESYCDYLITLWQPVKRCHSDMACPTVTAFKFCKIRHKKAREDRIQEDVPYYFLFDSTSEKLRPLTQNEITSFDFFLKQATNKRKMDRKTDILEYKSVPSAVEDGYGPANTNRH